jgi:hypothetical protein
LTDFVHKRATDILLLQEAKTEDVCNIVGYTTHLNIGDIGQWTAILVKGGFGKTRIARLLPRLGTAAVYKCFGFVNLYVSFETFQKQGHENFLIVGLPYTLESLPPSMTVGGDFNLFVSP